MSINEIYCRICLTDTRQTIIDEIIEMVGDDVYMQTVYQCNTCHNENTETIEAPGE